MSSVQNLHYDQRPWHSQQRKIQANQAAIATSGKGKKTADDEQKSPNVAWQLPVLACFATTRPDATHACCRIGKRAAASVTFHTVFIMFCLCFGMFVGLHVHVSYSTYSCIRIYGHTFSCFARSLSLTLALTLTLLSRLRKGSINWLQFWRQAASEDWGQHHAALERFWRIVNHGCRSVICRTKHCVIVRHHPVQAYDDAAKARAYGITLHGDEGQGKRGRNVLVISWSPLGMTKESMYSKYPFAVPSLGARNTVV